MRHLLLLARVRWVQFTVLGGALFAITPRAADPRSIVVTDEAIRAIAAADASRGQVESTDRRRALVERAVEDEVLYREGLRFGVQQGDAIVRQRVIQKVLFLAEELAGASRAPTDVELERYFDDHQADFALPARVRFHHVFSSNRDDLVADAADGAPAFAGQPSPVPTVFEDDLPAIEARLGRDFADAVGVLQPGKWSTPIASAFGFHRVLVEAREPGALPAFASVRRRVIEEFDSDRRKKAIQAFLDKSLSRYDVEVAGRRVDRLVASGRVAYRTDPSAED